MISLEIHGGSSNDRWEYIFISVKGKGGIDRLQGVTIEQATVTITEQNIQSQ